MSSIHETTLVAEALKTILEEGKELDDETVYALAAIETPEGLKALHEGAARLTEALPGKQFDSCSIINARSGRCSEDCKWCAQSCHHNTGCETYDLIPREECLSAARHNAAAGVRRFSLVASGKAVRGKALHHMADYLAEISRDCEIETCASMGLLGREELEELRRAGVRRYHCNLETAPSFFPSLCSTHTIEDKLRTIDMAHELGFEVCSGGIIGMGESRRQRAEFALALRRARPCSIPINILHPIPGTPLENTPALSEDEIIDAIAIFRFAHPRVQLRWAGGRARLSQEAQIRAMRTGINGGITGDLLTTTGSTIERDKQLANKAGYSF